MTKEMTIKMNFDRIIISVFIFCLAAEVIIFFMDIAMNLAEILYFEKFKELSNVAQEKSFGTWFSVVQNFIVSIIALIISLHHKFIAAQRGKSLGWLLVALFFAYISLDDHLVLHERISGTLRSVFLPSFYGKRITLPTYSWLFLFGPLFGAFGIFFLIFLFRQLNDKKFRIILITGLSLWVMAVILDAWDGTSHPYEWIIKITGCKTIYIRHSFMLVEEMLEMLGSTLFLYLFLSHIKLQSYLSIMISPARGNWRD
ncbi:MAG: hypothetical protein SV375_09150 [Thermodesulfobacteriota bacterium]|nr:hypothetical protein [Thermodesulfobacteriota bacterium]